MSSTEVVPRVAAPLSALAALALAMAAAADAPADVVKSGGAAAPSQPVVDRLSCAPDGAPRCAAGAILTVRGEGLGEARSVTFLGARGRADDRRARPRSRSSHRITVQVSRRARSGPVRVTSIGARTSRASEPLRIEEVAASEPQAPASSQKLYAGGPPAIFTYRAPAASAGQAAVEAYRVEDGTVVGTWPVQPRSDGTGEIRWDGTKSGRDVPAGRYAFRVTGQARTSVVPGDGTPSSFAVLDHMFPIRGRHDLGQSPTNGFGGGRGHKGQDMFAACGTRLAAARGGTVSFAAYQERAGNYVVVTGPDGRSYVYMHMLQPSGLRKGQRVRTGQTVGRVGETGRATGCHLHFELWTAPGWYQGGHAIDPLPELRRWDAFS